MKPAIAYVRVSTTRQGRSGLGLEGQRAALARFAEDGAFLLPGSDQGGTNGMMLQFGRQKEEVTAKP
jgi:DNA invertase Pin-like site-specific DNA recombinase